MDNLMSLNGGNYSIQDVVNLIGSQAVNVNQMAATLNHVVGTVGQLQAEQNELVNDVNYLKDQFNTLTLSGEQVAEIKRRVSMRVYETLGITSDADNRSKRDREMIRKYSRSLHMRVYRDIKKLGHLIIPIHYTRKINFQQVLNEIDAWNLREGIIAFMRNADERAEETRREGENNYGI